MKLLFDQNLSPRLVARVVDRFPASMHVREAGLARERGFAIVTKDSDFQERSQIAGSAPKVIWIRRGNCSTSDIEAMLKLHAPRIAALEQEQGAGFLILL